MLPLGVEIASRGKERRWSIILAGLRLEVSPARVERLRDRMRRKQKSKTPEEKAHARARLMRIFRSLGAEPGASPDRLEFGDLKEAWRILKRVFRHIRFRVRQFDVVVASADPALTGMAYGWACAAGALLPASAPLSLDVDFEQTQPRIDFRVEISTIPLLLTWEGARYLWKRLRFKFNRRHA